MKIKNDGFELIMVICIVALLLLLVWVLVESSNKPIIALRKEDWQCVKHENRTSLQPTLVGKITVMQNRTSSICMQYNRVAN